ncbi:hypothetical protein O181_040699 [Austropuccinia psidii MF-1]|uniref:Uncharacterized protein n=1 Tax=Austropuccinia psidii MF-1 TaxID=1389203 RepID=A0A9Q3DCY8_9BASI|nr:hypothetical protein [Austropuccinia psidii MF-1]
MSPVNHRDLGFQRNQPEDRDGLSRTRRPERGHLGHSRGWQNNEGDNINLAIHTPIQQQPQTRGMDGYGSSSSAPPTPQRYISMEHGQQKVQPGKRFPGEKKDTRAKKHLFQPKEERIRPHDPEIVGFGERSAQQPEVVVNHSRISTASNRNITPTQTEHNIVTSESNINSDTLCLQMSQYAEQSVKQFVELEASHERMNILTASMDNIIKNLQEGHAQLSKASEETNKTLNLVFEE